MRLFLHELKQVWRTLGRKPGFTLAAILILASGIGMNASIFSVLQAVLLRPLPYHQPERLVMLWHTAVGASTRIPATPAVFLDWRERQNVFTGIAAYEDASISHSARFYLAEGEAPERIMGARVSENLFDVLGVRAAQGRTFLPEDAQPGHQQVVILSDALWRRRFGAVPDLPGRTIQLNGRAYTVIGILPPEISFTWPAPTDLWVPIAFSAKDRSNRGAVTYKVVARLRPEVTLEQAQQSMNILAQALGQAYPETDKNTAVIVAPLHEELFGQTRLPLLILSAAAGLLWLLATVNFSGLFLVRATGRTHELAIRAAFGATRWQMIRHLLSESLCLSLGSGLAGVWLAAASHQLLVSIVPATLPRVNEIVVDWRIFLLACLLSLTAGIAASLTTMLHLFRTDLNETLKHGASHTTASCRTRRLLNLLVVTETALTLVLLCGSALMIRSFWKLQEVESGFQADNVLSMQFTIPAWKKLDEEQEAQITERILQSVRMMPGVLSAASSSSIPLRGTDYLVRLEPHSQLPVPGSPQSVRWRSVSPDYLRVMGIPLLKGRGFTEQDTSASQKVLLLSESSANRFFGNEEPLGKSLKVKKHDYLIVGVVADVRHNGLKLPAEPALYVPMAQEPTSPVCLSVRTASNPMSLVTAIQQAVRAEDKDLPVEKVSTMDQLLREESAGTRFHSFVLGAFALTSLLLGAAGIYSLLAWTTAQRTREIGIRLALGAQPSNILRQVIINGMLPTLTGLSIGLVVIFALTRLMRSLLYGITSSDAISVVSSVVLLTVAALLACYFPARRAMKIAPVSALRYE